MELATLEVPISDASTADTLPPLGPSPELERLGDEIAELSAHLDAASARLLDLIREFERAGRLEHRLPVLRRVALLAHRPRPRRGPGEGAGGARPWRPATRGARAGPRRDLLREGPGHHARGDCGYRGAVAGHRPGWHRPARRTDRPRLAPD